MAMLGGNSMSPTYNPLQVGMKPGTSPYIGGTPSNTARTATPKLVGPIGAAQPPQPPQQKLGAQGILATGSGPGGAAYGQNLANYSGGQFMRPQGGLQFNPFQIGQTQFGAPTGGGNAPSYGIPQTLLGQAQGGQPFAPTPPPAPPATSNLNAAASPEQQYSIEQLFSSPQGGLGY